MARWTGCRHLTSDAQTVKHQHDWHTGWTDLRGFLTGKPDVLKAN